MVYWTSSPLLCHQLVEVVSTLCSGRGRNGLASIIACMARCRRAVPLSRIRFESRMAIRLGVRLAITTVVHDARSRRGRFAMLWTRHSDVAAVICFIVLGCSSSHVEIALDHKGR